MLLNEFLELCPYIYQRATAFLEKPQQVVEWVEQARQKVQYNRYGIGGKVLHRGAMCPDPFFELDCNINRGKVTNRRPKRLPYYQYGFDEKNRLLLVDRESPTVPLVEVLVPEDLITWGFMIPRVFLSKKELDPGNIDTIYGHIFEGNHIVAYFTTRYIDLNWRLDKTTAILAPALYEGEDSYHRKVPCIETRLVHYENGLPVLYSADIDCYLKLDQNGNAVETVPSVFIRRYQLIVNQEGDVVQFGRIPKGETIQEPVEIVTLNKPIPRERWDNRFGL